MSKHEDDHAVNDRLMKGDEEVGFKPESNGTGNGTAAKSKDDGGSENGKRCCVIFIVIAILLALAAAAVFIVFYFLKAPRVVDITSQLGTIQGRRVASQLGPEVVEYLGIPFAKPPVGQLRYANPEPIDSLPQEPYEAFDYKYSCIQALDTQFGDFAGSQMWNAPNPVSEDCLYLNIWTPGTASEAKRPVLVWIYGGGFFSGSNALWVYDGKTLAAFGDVLVVSFNYRVRSLGYLATGDGRIKGNFGMMDQVLALRWVKDHISSFGGDPDSITVLGESSGASSIGMHMMSELSQDLFQRAVFESGSPDAVWTFMDHNQAKERSEAYFKAVECEQEDTEELLSCLRALDTQTILDQDWVTPEFMVFPWAPTVDGTFLTDRPDVLLDQGKIAKKDSLLGVNKDEGTYWILYLLPNFYYNSSSPQTYEHFTAGVDSMLHDLPDNVRTRVKDYYTRHEIGDTTDVYRNRDAFDKVSGDRLFTCPTKQLTDSLTKNGMNTYMYYLTYRASTEVWHPWLGTIHGAEIQWIFGMPANESRKYTTEELEFSKDIMSYWINFAKTGDPNGPGLAPWPRYTETENKFVEWRGPDNFITNNTLREGFCDMWEEIERERIAESRRQG